MNISVTELPNFIRKYYLLHELLIFKYRRQNISVSSQIRDADQLKSRLIEEWERFHQVVIDEAAWQWRPRLGACVRLRAHGGHFEHRLWMC